MYYFILYYLITLVFRFKQVPFSLLKSNVFDISKILCSNIKKTGKVHRWIWKMIEKLLYWLARDIFSRIPNPRIFFMKNIFFSFKGAATFLYLNRKILPCFKVKQEKFLEKNSWIHRLGIRVNMSRTCYVYYYLWPLLSVWIDFLKDVMLIIPITFQSS